MFSRVALPPTPPHTSQCLKRVGLYSDLATHKDPTDLRSIQNSKPLKLRNLYNICLSTSLDMSADEISTTTSREAS